MPKKSILETGAVREFVDVKPANHGVLVQFLTRNETLGTQLHLGGEENDAEAPQGYVLKIGPKVTEDCGFGVGDRVIVTGTYTPLPSKLNRNGRKLGIVEPHAIKAVLIEDE